ncbi:MAG: DUF4846 domain-containing protein [Bacteroidota bacterium]
MQANKFFPFFFSISLFCCNQSGKGSQNTSAPGSPQQQRIQIINEKGNTIVSRFNVPDGYERKSFDVNSFGYYLRNLPLKPAGSIALYYDGNTKNDLVYDAVVDMDIGTKDLQQCADAVMRLRGEYFFSIKQYDSISFVLTNGFRMDYSEWMKGNRLVVSGNKTHWSKSAESSNTYKDFRKYMDVVFNYAGSLSLSKSMKPKIIRDIAIGDVFVHGGLPGHAVIVVDVAESKSRGKIFMIAQSFMPAQEIHILKNFSDESNNPWYKNSIAGQLNSPQWSFPINELKSFD